MTRFYITTPIYYVNDVPHLGHAYTTIAADALARFHRMRGDDTWFLTGTDEHGQKIEEAARARGLTATELVDQVAPRFAEAWRDLGIANDDFIRTTEPRHAAVVNEVWRRMHARGDLYLASYEGWYCVGCEAFYTESQLDKIGGEFACTQHKRPVAWVAKERSWFFALSKYQAPLIAHIEAHPDFIRPEAYRSEVLAFLRGGLRDLSVSRTSFQWGLPVPDPDPDGLAHVMYVWLDALTNYLSALGPIDGARSQAMWPAAIHLIGKDILRFHAVYWPAFLLSAGLPLPKGILCHGWWTVRGEKISKSLPATRIDPLRLAQELGAASTHALGVDAMRYYLLREVPLGNDGDFTFEGLFARTNAELANDLGNLVNRCLTLVPRLIARAGGVAITTPAWRAREADARLAEVLGLALTDSATHYEAFAPARALDATWRAIREANRYVDATQPWKLANDGAPAEAGHVAEALLGALRTIARMIAPVLPAAAVALAARVEPEPDGLTRWPTGPLPGGALAGDGALLMFPRLDDKRQAQIVAAMVGAEPAPPAELAPPTAVVAPTMPAAPAAATAPVGLAPITYDDFAKLELRVGRVIAASAVPKAKKLLQLSVDLGEPAPRTIVAGIAEAFTAEAMIGKQVLVVANLAPATIRGVVSQGMILAAGDEAILGLGAVSTDVPPGTRVR